MCTDRTNQTLRCRANTHITYYYYYLVECRASTNHHHHHHHIAISYRKKTPHIAHPRSLAQFMTRRLQITERRLRQRSPPNHHRATDHQKHRVLASCVVFFFYLFLLYIIIRWGGRRELCWVARGSSPTVNWKNTRVNKKNIYKRFLVISHLFQCPDGCAVSFVTSIKWWIKKKRRRRTTEWNISESVIYNLCAFVDAIFSITSSSIYVYYMNTHLKIGIWIFCFLIDFAVMTLCIFFFII